ncbi:Uncharacterised protein [Mycobacteroides abscessus subsp. massiliense]|nr:Uncharacterised protein [Mycobacteroides abscessus subsp. massiliense]
MSYNGFEMPQVLRACLAITNNANRHYRNGAERPRNLCQPHYPASVRRYRTGTGECMAVAGVKGPPDEDVPIFDLLTAA